MDAPIKNQKIKLIEINSYLTCYLCKGYLIDATTISECLHSFCRSCIIKFLQENSHCPVCEVMINKAKPNIKLDKTLQDIVYKLVPELFLREMRRRQRFYRDHPVEAAKATPEARGEDTERTIFSPSDIISLSIEYISDDSTPGAIVVPTPLPPPTATVTFTTTTDNVKSGGGGGGEQDSTILKRFLQCPSMCRVEVLKKFVRNKYNVDTIRFYIDILYKKVPLPDHYTLIDIAYIYSWKRNEPMKFFFRISDINTVTERFDYLGPLKKPPLSIAEKRPAPTPTTTDEKPAKTVRFTVPAPVVDKKHHRQSPAARKTTVVEAKKSPPVVPTTKKVPVQVSAKKKVVTEVAAKKKCATEKVKKDEIVPVDANKEITEIKNRIQKEPLSEKSSVYTNITLNRSNNVEIITKIQKVSNKNGQPIGLNIIKQTVKKSKPVVEPAKDKEVAMEVKKEKNEEQTPPAPSEPILPTPVPMEMDLEKSNFLKSIELTAKNSLPAVSPQKVVALNTTPPPPPPPTKLPPSSQKRKSSSPAKRPPPPKLKTIPNPTVRQMVTNVMNQSATTVTKIAERNANLKTLFDNCKINIPSSLSITLKESSDSDGERGRTSVPVKPVQNYIEILRLPDAAAAATDNSDAKNSRNNTRTPPQTFQKMFEETIKKPEFTKLLTVPRKREQKTALDLSDTKRKHTAPKNGKVAVVKAKLDGQSVDCHSPSLGMNYKVSVGQSAQTPHKVVVSSSTVSPPNKQQTSPLDANQLLEQYNLQNLAQLTATFNFNTTVMSQAGQQLAALQQAMLLKQFENQNHQNWLNMNSNAFVQYQNYLQSLQNRQHQNHLVGKEN